VPAPISTEIQAQQRRSALAVAHGCNIYYVPCAPIQGKLPQIVEITGVKWQLLEECPPNKHGNYFGKLVT
jgi:hypothetical protein